MNIRFLSCWIFAPLLLSLLAGCANLLNPPPRRDPDYAPARAEDMTPPAQNTGSIFQSGYDVRLFENQRARRVGDNLTVIIVEANTATKQADTEASRDASTDVSVPMFGGVSINAMQATLQSANAMKGKGKSQQNNFLSGSLTVTVVEVLPNGNLRVQGEKRMGLNQGSEFMKLSGIVRQIDISTDNTVLSSRVSDATFIYNGEGALADANRQGWAQRFFMSILFPY